MELKYDFLIYVSIFIVLVCAVAFVLGVRRKKKYSTGKKIASLGYIENTKALKSRKIVYRILTIVSMVSCVAALVFCIFMAARPYEMVTYEEERFSRDIIICMDISTSVDDLNMAMINRLKKTVKSLKNERIGVVIFNTTPVLICPLTNDYEYVIEVLDGVSEGLRARNAGLLSFIGTDNFYDSYYASQFISSGTLIGNDLRGSSLIGDGLAGAAYSFMDNEDKDRTKVIIFTTDNEVEGEPVVTLSQAADICAQKDIVVFGIGTARMKQDCEDDMKVAVVKTGGTYYRENESGSMTSIVDSIEEMSGSLVAGIKDIRIVDHPELFMVWITIFTAATIISAWVIKI